MTSESDNQSPEEGSRQQESELKKERKIKIIRILTVIVYLTAVSSTSVMLSSYYMFVWKPHAGNMTLTPNTDGMAMALLGDKYHGSQYTGKPYKNLGKTSTPFLAATKTDRLSTTGQTEPYSVYKTIMSTKNEQSTTVDWQTISDTTESSTATDQS
ncbi:uncharacterized protein LOC126844482 [Adelges cooleyi]|uniref:uncharacterized protein LOC126844482 n=1 Tax=Adelges cooleyi TaxID=133065 RepID=UPI0021805332|nr:uncharacterized protein LOC126844482 [Adelges cooleyi]